MSYKALIKFLSSEEGGRYSPPISVYKPQIKIGNAQISCWICFEDSESKVMNFGIEHTVTIELQFKDNYPDESFLKEKIEIYEGAKLVGIGKFLVNLNPS